MATIYERDVIEKVVANLPLLGTIEDGFAAHAQGRVVVPPVGELNFQDPPGDTHIKYGYIKDDDVFVIKIASGFYENPTRGLESGSGCMLVFSQETGQLYSILLDEGYLTDVRTALAGAIAAKYLAPKEVDVIGVLGTGVQARMQVLALADVRPCKRIAVWGRSPDGAMRYLQAMEGEGYEVTLCDTPADVAAQAKLLITTTPSATPLLNAKDVQVGTHITAMGSDTPGKQELAVDVIARADLVVADSRSQCVERGEIAKAVQAGVFELDKAIELGEVVQQPSLGRTSENQITVADLTGVAHQDIQIAKAVVEALG